ncbi:unnamed protein product [Owenia fusiformis]|uniref:Uncharacterized protein n=1 Tax=Owenia fusiformis TaxID=6347 RepID=A0A8J1TD83_OWEFU|nr:unnamed protein product [Owenia fusiformis]
MANLIGHQRKDCPDSLKEDNSIEAAWLKEAMDTSSIPQPSKPPPSNIDPSPSNTEETQAKPLSTKQPAKSQLPAQQLETKKQNNTKSKKDDKTKETTQSTPQSTSSRTSVVQRSPPTPAEELNLKSKVHHGDDQPP